MSGSYDNALKAIGAMFSDRSVPAATTLRNLLALRDEIDIFVDALNTDVENAAREMDEEYTDD